MKMLNNVMKHHRVAFVIVLVFRGNKLVSKGDRTEHRLYGLYRNL